MIPADTCHLIFPSSRQTSTSSKTEAAGVSSPPATTGMEGHSPRAGGVEQGPSSQPCQHQQAASTQPSYHQQAASSQPCYQQNTPNVHLLGLQGANGPNGLQPSKHIEQHLLHYPQEQQQHLLQQKHLQQLQLQEAVRKQQFQFIVKKHIAKTQGLTHGRRLSGGVPRL